MSSRPKSDFPRLTVHRCVGGHAFVNRYDTCPLCGGAMSTSLENAAGRLISHTTVRVNPTGAPCRLGIAQLESGAKTLCIVEGDLPREAEPQVALHQENGLFYATVDHRDRR